MVDWILWKKLCAGEQTLGEIYNIAEELLRAMFDTIKYLLGILLFVFLCNSCCSIALADVKFGPKLIVISPEASLAIGVKIWFNECDGSVSGLTSWNNGESFASLGIGHFIWYPFPGKASSHDGFPRLLRYMKERGIAIPDWLKEHDGLYCPWKSRTEFLQAQYSNQMIELRQFLRNTIAIQAEFMTYRLEETFPQLLTTVSAVDRPYIFQQFCSMARTPIGIYAMVDYLNFKGAGVSVSQQSFMRGSGLLQVLGGMRYAPPGMSQLQAYVWSAKNALIRRVEKAPPEYHQERWLAGWFRRLNTYMMQDIIASSGRRAVYN